MPFLLLGWVLVSAGSSGHRVDEGGHLSTGHCEPLVPACRRYLGLVIFFLLPIVENWKHANSGERWRVSHELARLPRW